MLTRNPKPFTVEGTAVDQEAIVRIRAEIEDRIEDDMRSTGYAPFMEITPELYWEYDKDAENFKYLIRVYGVFVGKHKAKNIMGVLGGKPIYFESDR